MCLIFFKQKKEEDKRKREEEEKQKREQENKRNMDGGNRFGNRRPMDENRDGGGEPSGADADKWVRAGPMQQSTDRGGKIENLIFFVWIQFKILHPLSSWRVLLFSKVSRMQ